MKCYLGHLHSDTVIINGQELPMIGSLWTATFHDLDLVTRFRRNMVCLDQWTDSAASIMDQIIMIGFWTGCP